VTDLADSFWKSVRIEWQELQRGFVEEGVCSLETRQEVVSAREERLRDANSSVIFGRRCGRGQGQEPFNAVARNLRTAEL
jgi:hypothetical protein